MASVPVRVCSLLHVTQTLADTIIRFAAPAMSIIHRRCRRESGAAFSKRRHLALSSHFNTKPATLLKRSRSARLLRDQFTQIHTHTHTHTHRFNGPLSGTTRVSRYQKGKTNLDFTEARDIGWQWPQLGRLHLGNHASTPPLSFLQAGCPSCRPTNSVKALKAQH